MGRIIEKLLCLAAILIFLTFCIRHGVIDFSWFDKIATKTTDAIQSEEGQQVVSETKDIAKDITVDMVTGLKDAVVNTKNRLTVSSEDRVPCKLLKVVDGDTIDVELNGKETRIRFIGIDTPESVNPDEGRNNEYGEEASAYTKMLLTGIENLYLEFDSQITDDYGRTLAYVWLTETNKNTTEVIGKYMVNGIIVKDGYAKAKDYPPNIRYSSSLSMLQDEAKKKADGLWAKVDLTNL